jgi:hypothetical protein
MTTEIVSADQLRLFIERLERLIEDKAAIASLAERVAQEIAWAVVRDVAELGDRESPSDWPEAMLVTSSELCDIFLTNIEGIIPLTQVRRFANQDA